MTLAHLTTLAEAAVSRALESLPEDVRTAAGQLPVLYHGLPSPSLLGEEFDDDILGLFVGNAHGQELGDNHPLPTQIMLFLQNIWDFAENDPQVFQEEVRITYLHELGHYFGWDEQDLEIRGLD